MNNNNNRSVNSPHEEKKKQHLRPQRDPFFLSSSSTHSHQHIQSIRNKQKKTRPEFVKSESSEEESNMIDDDPLKSQSSETDNDLDDELNNEIREMPFEELTLLRKIDSTDNFKDKIKLAIEENKKKQRNRQKITKKGTSQESTQQLHKRSKSEPPELSAKIPVSRKRIVIPIQKRIARDPRFDTLSGKFNPDLFKKSYAFLDDLKEQEIQNLKQEIQKEKDPITKAKLQRGLQILEQRRLQEKRKELRQQIKSQHRKKEQELVAKGKNPFFLKRSQLKEFELIQKYKEMKTSGQLEKYLAKKRKRQAKKEHKLVPFKRRKTEKEQTSQ